MIQVQCASCSKRYSVPDQFAGRKMRCKSCDGVIAIPEEGPEEPLEREPSSETEAGDGGADDTKLSMRAGASASADVEGEAARARARKPGPKFPPKGKFGAKKPSFTRKPKGSLDSALEASSGPAVPGEKAGARKLGKIGARPGAKIGGPRKGVASRAQERELEAPGGGEEGVEARSGGRKKLLLIGGGVVALAAILFGVWHFFLRDEPRRTPRKASPVVADAEAEAARAASKGGADGPAKAEALDLRPADVLSLFPQDAPGLVYVGVEELAKSELLRNKVDESMKEEDKILLTEMQLEPWRDVKRIWVALTGDLVREAPAEMVPGGGIPSTAPPTLIVVEGTFNPDQIKAALQAHDFAKKEEETFGRISALALLNDRQEPAGYLAFLSPEMALLGNDAMMNAAGRALSAPTAGLRGNSALAKLTGDFKPGGYVWLGGILPEEMRKKAGDAGTAGAGDAGATPGAGPPAMEAPDVEAAHLALGPSKDNTGLGLAGTIVFPNAQERAKLLQLKLALPMLLMQLPEPLKKIVQQLKLEPDADEKVAKLELDLSRQLLEPVLDPAFFAGLLGGMGAPGEAPGAEPGEEGIDVSLPPEEDDATTETMGGTEEGAGDATLEETPEETPEEGVEETPEEPAGGDAGAGTE